MLLTQAIKYLLIVIPACCRQARNDGLNLFITTRRCQLCGSARRRTWQRNEVFNWKPELFEYVRTSLLSPAAGATPLWLPIRKIVTVHGTLKLEIRSSFKPDLCFVDAAFRLVPILQRRNPYGMHSHAGA